MYYILIGKMMMKSISRIFKKRNEFSRTNYNRKVSVEISRIFQILLEAHLNSIYIMLEFNNQHQ